MGMSGHGERTGIVAAVIQNPGEQLLLCLLEMEHRIVEEPWASLVLQFHL